MEKKNELLLRVYLIFLAFVLFSGIIVAKVVKTTVIEGDKWRDQGNNTVKWIEVEGERGNIYDEHGNLLATSLPYFDTNVDLLTSSNDNFNKNIDGLSKKLAKHFGSTSNEWKTKLVNKRREGKKSSGSNARFYPLLKKLTKDQLDLLKTFPLFNLGKYKGGLIVTRKNRRERPYRTYAKRTIGKNSKQTENKGIEQAFDKFLAGDSEKRLMRKLPGDTWIPVLDPSEMLQERGADIVTTLDMHIQDIVHNELKEVLIQHQAKKGVAVVMDVKTGAIKAMSNLVRRADGSVDEDWNHAIGTRSEPGSTFKLISAMAMLETGKIDLDTEVALFGGKKKFFDYHMYDSHRHGIAKSTFKEAFAISSNIGMGYAAYKIFGKKNGGWNAFHASLEKMGVMDKTGIEIAGESTPGIKNPRKKSKNEINNWSGTTVPWMAHGYELTMTPLQVLNYYNAVANDGKLMKPYLVSEIRNSEGKSISYKPQVLKENIVSPSTILKAQDMLKAVAESGTAKGLKVDDLTFAGKTGTTKLRYWEESEKESYNASFAGYFPEENPKYSVIVVVYEPEGKDYYGAKVAGPVFRNIMQRLNGYENTTIASDLDAPKVLFAHSGHKSDYKAILDFIGIDYKDRSKGSWVEMSPDGKDVTLNTEKLRRDIVPDLRGKGLRDAVFIAETVGLEIESEGVGKVYKQSLKPGTKISKRQIRIYLK